MLVDRLNFAQNARTRFNDLVFFYDVNIYVLQHKIQI